MTMTRETIEELKRLHAAMTNCDSVLDFDELAGFCVPKSMLDQFESLLALAERALEPQGQHEANCATLLGSSMRGACDCSLSQPQGQAMPVEKGSKYPGWYITDMEDTLSQLATVLGSPQHDADALIAKANLYASQLSLPAGPEGELSAAIKHVRAQERSLGKVVIGGDPSEVGLSFRVQQLGFAIDNLEQAFATHPSPPRTAIAQPVLTNADWTPLGALASRFPEINFSNYGEEDVMALQEWAFEAVDALKAAESAAVAQPVADERAAWKPNVYQVMEWARMRGFGYKLSAEQICGLADDIIAHIAATLCQPAEEGDNA